MGYTHYVKGTVKCPDDQWANILGVALQAIDHAGVPLEGTEVSWQGIVFNGCAEEGHETFVLTQLPQESGFCKTARKPYDLTVCMVLEIARRIAPVYHVLSDGDMESEENWPAARKFADEVLGKPAP